MKVGVLGVRGFPARYGAFEELASNLVHHCLDVDWVIGCERSFHEFGVSNQNIHRVFSIRLNNGLGVIFYNINIFIKMYMLGVRRFLACGEGAAFLFPIMRALGCRVACNTDGVEWRRRKWGRVACRYFKVSELLSARYANRLIFDAVVLKRYYGIHLGVTGDVLRYGCDISVSDSVKTGWENCKYILVVMRLEPENNIKEIVEGFLLSSTDCTLVLIGPSTKYFEVNVLPIVNNETSIEWLGPIFDRRFLAQMRDGCQVYIHGHSVGGTNPTLVEAISGGCPVVAFDTRFNREVLGGSARYFKSTSTLADSLTLEPIFPPVLGSEYGWEYICKRYAYLLKNI